MNEYDGPPPDFTASCPVCFSQIEFFTLKAVEKEQRIWAHRIKAIKNKRKKPKPSRRE